MRRTMIERTIAVLLLAILLAGCSSTPQPPGADPTPTATIVPSPTELPEPTPAPREWKCDGLDSAVDRSMCIIAMARSRAHTGGTWAVGLCESLTIEPFRKECVDHVLPATPPWSAPVLERLCAIDMSREGCKALAEARTTGNPSRCPPLDTHIGRGCVMTVARELAMAGDQRAVTACTVFEDPFFVARCSRAAARAAVPDHPELARQVCGPVLDSIFHFHCIQGAALLAGSTDAVQALCDDINFTVSRTRCLIDALARTRLAVHTNMSMPVCRSSPEWVSKCTADVAARVAVEDHGPVADLCAGLEDGADCAVVVARVVGRTDLGAAIALCDRFATGTFVHDSCLAAAVSSSPCIDPAACADACTGASTPVERDGCLLSILTRISANVWQDVCKRAGSEVTLQLCAAASRAVEGDDGAATCGGLADRRDREACFGIIVPGLAPDALARLADTCAAMDPPFPACLTAIATEGARRHIPEPAAPCLSLQDNAARDTCLLESFAETIGHDHLTARAMCDQCGDGPERDMCMAAAVAADIAPDALPVALDICEGLELSEETDSCRYGVARALAASDPVMAAEVCEHVIGVFWRDRCSTVAADHRSSDLE